LAICILITAAAGRFTIKVVHWSSAVSR